MVKDYGDRPTCTLTSSEVEEWLDIYGKGPQNRNNYRATFRACFAYAVKRGIVTTNPVDAIDKAKVETGIPVHWPVERVEALLRAAQAFNPDMVPVLAVLAFAGTVGYRIR
jgi:site-specific recombinase XerD